ncbi:hypothetical protein DERF_000220 [Dermatophagoides farinae]|uniref:Uncharacterized protein n=1 Tax=Dermatophagoides farinae TaxID=6954 RepID=A0A922LCB6_DERFA|nr:hypothetical protein HUG17_8066 [Dermatophagoides farinae]KAH9526105.1 hypothetical protein DERF_000220 [Dermatophagoides farinae]
MIFLRLRLQQLKNEIIRGWYQVPYFYFSLGMVGISCIGVAYHYLTKIPDDESFKRHKTRYIVIRPDDVRLQKYPLKYITDRDLVEKYRQQQQQQQQ